MQKFYCLSCKAKLKWKPGELIPFEIPCHCEKPEEKYVTLPESELAATTKRVKLAVFYSLKGGVVSVSPEDRTFVFFDPTKEGEEEAFKRYKVTVEEL